MKRIFLLLSLLLLPLGLSGITYEPGDLINAVKRSQVITQLFLERWEVVENSLDHKELSKMKVQEQFYYINRGSYAGNFDLYFHGENISGYPVNTPYGKYDLTLFRLFGSTIIKMEDLVDFGIFQWGLAFGIAGYRYGLYKEISLNSTGKEEGGVDSENFSVKDYIYTQVFDDLIVITNLFRPLGYLHIGIVLNEQTDPGDNGMIDENDDTKTQTRLFFDSNILDSLFLNLGYDSKNETANFFTSKLDIFSLMELPGWVQRRALWPDLFIGYAYVEAPYDKKLEDAPDTKAQHTLFMELHYTYYNAFYLKLKSELFLGGQSTNEKEHGWKQNYGEIGFRLNTFDILKNPTRYYGKGTSHYFASYYIITGFSYLVDDRSMYYGNSSSEIYGFSLGLKATLATTAFGLSMEARISRNYSPKLYNLIESYEHWIYELSIQAGF